LWRLTEEGYGWIARKGKGPPFILLSRLVDNEPCPLFVGYGIAGNRVTNRIPRTSRACRIAVSCFGLEHPRHMLSGIIAYQVLQQEKPTTIEKVKAVLEKHSW
jgi:hypothetical protein